jgi:hypothetical protein
MLSTGNQALNVAIKTELANSSSLKSTHQVTAEWNYNAYTLHEEIGCYFSNGTYDDGYQQYSYTVGADPVVIKTDTFEVDLFTQDKLEKMKYNLSYYDSQLSL